MTFTPSSEQAEFFATLANLSGPSISLRACAGAGKSTTIEHSLTYLPKRMQNGLPPSIAVFAFSKDIVISMKARMGERAEVKTIHACGKHALESFGIVPRGRKPDAWKCSNILRELLPSDDEDFSTLTKLISLGKSQPTRTPDWPTLCALHELDFLFGETTACVLAQRVLDLSFTDRSCIDFDDMLWLPCVLNLHLTQYDYIFVDEAQDLNDVQVEMLARMHKPTTRLVCVGDPHQAIYGFRGAGHGMMDIIAERFNMRQMPLSVSYRCPQNVVKEAQKYLSK